MRNTKTPQGTETAYLNHINNFSFTLRNTKTPQGTETVVPFRFRFRLIVLRNTKTPQGTETIDAKFIDKVIKHIEKYEDPAGDGNPGRLLYCPLAFGLLRNTKTPQGTETSAMPYRMSTLKSY